MKLARFSFLSVLVDGAVNKLAPMSAMSTGGAVRPRLESLRCGRPPSLSSLSTEVLGADKSLPSLETSSDEFEKNRRMPCAGLLSVRLRGG